MLPHGLGIPWHQALGQSQGGNAADSECCGAAEEIPPLDAAVAIVVVEVVDLLFVRFAYHGYRLLYL